MQVLKISIQPWSIELGNVLTDQVITIQWECKTCNTIHTQDVTSLARFSTKQVDLDLVLPDLYALLSYFLNF